MNNYTERLDAWFEAEKKKGLVDLKFFSGDLKGATVETFAREALDVLNVKKAACTHSDF